MSTTRQYSVYLLKSLKDSQNYTGLSSNVEKRFKMHNAGKVKSTKSRCPFQLVYQEFVGTLKNARAREKYFKSAAGRKYLENIVSQKYTSEGVPCPTADAVTQAGTPSGCTK